MALFLDATFLAVRPDGPKDGVLIAWGFTDQDERVLLQETPASGSLAAALDIYRNVPARLSGPEDQEHWLTKLANDMSNAGVLLDWPVLVAR